MINSEFVKVHSLMDTFIYVALIIAGVLMILLPLGQVIAVCIVMDNAYIAYYIAPLLLSGTIAGVVIGVASAALIDRVKKHLRFL